MGINFPASPIVGQKYPQPAVAGIPVYTWDGEKWTTVGGSIAAYAPPADAVPLMDATPGLVGTTTEYAREDHVHPTDTSRATYDAMAYSGMQINGGMDVSQEYSGISTGWLNFGGNPIDGWRFDVVQVTAGSTAFTGGQVASTLPGIPNCLVLNATVAGNFASASDTALIGQRIEGYRWAKLGFGYTAAQSVTVGFWVYTAVVGKICVSITSNGTQRRIYIQEVTVNAANTWEYKTLTFPPDVSGAANWLTTNGIGALLHFCFGAGSTVKGGTAGVWANQTTQYATVNQTNFFTSNGNAVYLTGVTVLPGTQAPIAAQSPNIMRPYDQELAACQRYWCSSYPLGVAGGTPGIATNLTMTCDGTTVLGGSYAFPVEMRASPTIKMWGYGGTVNAWSNTGGTDITTGTLTPTSKAISTGYSAVALPVGGIFLTHFQADARL